MIIDLAAAWSAVAVPPYLLYKLALFYP